MANPWTGKEPLSRRGVKKMRCVVCGYDAPNMDEWRAHILKGCSSQTTKPKREGSVEMTETEEMPSLDSLGEIELPEYDLTKYIGKKVKVTGVDVISTKYGAALQIQTEDLETIKKSDGTVVRINASKMVGLQKDESGKWGWGPNTKCGKFLKSMKVEHPKALLGKLVVVQFTAPNEDGKKFLTF